MAFDIPDLCRQKTGDPGSPAGMTGQREIPGQAQNDTIITYAMTHSQDTKPSSMRKHQLRIANYAL